MAATVYDGSLQFTSNIDDSELMSDAARMEKTLTQIIEVAEKGNKAMTDSNNKQVESAKAAVDGVNKLHAALQQIIEANSGAFNIDGMQQFASSIEASAKSILDMVAAAGSNFSTAQLQELDAQLKNASTDSETLATVFQFLKDNIASLKLSPTDAQSFTEQLNVLSATLLEVKESAAATGQEIAQSFQRGLPELDLTKASVQQLEDELDRLIQLEGLLKRTINTTQDQSVLSGATQGLKNTENRINEIATRLDTLNAKKLAGDLGDASKNGANLLSQLRELRYAIAGAIQQYGEGSPEVLKLTNQAAELEQRLKNAQRQVSLFASNTAGLDALKQGFNGLVGGVTALVAATSLLSGDNDALQDTMVKLFAAMQVVNGAEQLFSVLNKNSAVSVYLKGLAVKASSAAAVENTAATAANTTAQAAETAVVEANTAAFGAQAAAEQTATVATGGLTAATAALAIPLGIVALVLAEIVGIYEIFKQRARDAALAQELLNDKIENAAKLSHQSVADIKAQGDIAVAGLKAAGAAQSEIRDEQLRQLDQVNDLAQRDYNAAAQNLQQLQGKLVSKYGGQVVNGSIVGADKFSKDDLANYQKANELLLQAQQRAQGASTALTVKQIEDEQQLTQEGIRDYSAALATRIAKFKEAGNQEQALEIQKEKNLSDAKAQAWGQDAAIRTQLFAEAAQKNAEIDTQLKNLEISNAESVAKEKLALAQKGSLDEFTAKAQLIDLNAQKEILAAKNNQDKINAVKAQMQKDLNDLSDQTNAEEIAREKAAVEAQTSARLQAVQEGSKEELDLKLKLIAQQEKFDTANVQFTIKNEQGRQTAISNIHTNALKERQDAEKNYWDKVYDLRIQASKAQTAQNALPFESQQNNPLLTNYQKDESGINAILTRRQGLQDQLQIRQDEYNAAVSRGSTNLAEYQKKINDLNAALAVLNAMLGNQQNQAAIDHSTAIAQDIQSIAQGFAGLSSQLQAINPQLAETAQTLSEVAGQASNIYLAFSGTLSQQEATQVAIQGTVSLLGMVVTSSAQRHQAEAQFNQDLINQQNAYNHALNEAILLNYKLKDNIFITDYQAQITDGVKALDDATDKYQQALKKLDEVQVIAGKRNKVDLGRVATGAATGAAVGTAILPGIGTAVGAVVGGIVGIFSKKSKDVLKPILQEYPELIDQTKKGVDRFNDGLAQSLIDSKLVKGQSEAILKDLIDWKDAVKAANQQIEDAVSTLAGQLGDNLRDSLVQAFEDGTDAGKAFAKSVGDSLENVLKQLLFNAVFGEALKNLQDKLTTTLENGGDVTDVYRNFFATYSGLSKEFTDNLKALQQQAASSGFDIFQGSQQGSNPNSLAGAIKGISEDTATLLAGQFNAIRLEEITQTQLQKVMSNNMVKQVSLMTKHLNYAIRIEANTGRTAQLAGNLVDIRTFLKSIDGKISDSDAVKRANGVK